MQLLRVVSTMSYQGSPYSGPGDEYDFEDDGYDDIDEYREREDTLQQPGPVEDSDEGESDLRLEHFVILLYIFLSSRSPVTLLVHL